MNSHNIKIFAVMMLIVIVIPYMDAVPCMHSRPVNNPPLSLTDGAERNNDGKPLTNTSSMGTEVRKQNDSNVGKDNKYGISSMDEIDRTNFDDFGGKH
ncbi:Hypothetical protein CINCED_3A018428 [Cinara cedri]|uniref:Uncharacterized protein n=1 Tax=Cinara cedri TaxID=506608 RepID=A0A5E4MR48_9HEMI|nr:Hypothetical protein CINCED_3A018428 [Cinara cedri]